MLVRVNILDGKRNRSTHHEAVEMRRLSQFVTKMSKITVVAAAL